MARILIIDEDPLVRVMLQNLLKSAGHEVLLAADSREGLTRHKETPADLLITDTLMPNQEGLKMIIRLRKAFPRLAIIAMSGKPAGLKLLSLVNALGAIEVFQKPFGPDQLLMLVERALGSWQCR